MKKAKVEVQDANPEEPVVAQENVVGEIPVAESTAPNATEAALAELTNDLQRTRADFENFRKQVEVQKSQAMAAAKYATVTKFLPLVDDFSRAIDAYSEQLSPLRKSLD